VGHRHRNSNRNQLGICSDLECNRKFWCPNNDVLHNLKAHISIRKKHCRNISHLDINLMGLQHNCKNKSQRRRFCKLNQYYCYNQEVRICICRIQCPSRNQLRILEENKCSGRCLSPNDSQKHRRVLCIHKRSYSDFRSRFSMSYCLGKSLGCKCKHIQDHSRMY